MPHCLICLWVCLFVAGPFVCLAGCIRRLSVCLSTLYVCIHVCLSACLPANCLGPCLSVHLSAACLSAYMPTCQLSTPVCLSAYLSVCLHTRDCPSAYLSDSQCVPAYLSDSDCASACLTDVCQCRFAVRDGFPPACLQCADLLVYQFIHLAVSRFASFSSFASKSVCPLASVLPRLKKVSGRHFCDFTKQGQTWALHSVRVPYAYVCVCVCVCVRVCVRACVRACVCVCCL